MFIAWLLLQRMQGRDIGQKLLRTWSKPVLQAVFMQKYEGSKMQEMNLHMFLCHWSADV